MLVGLDVVLGAETSFVPTATRYWWDSII